MNELLKKDLINRANNLYEYFTNLITTQGSSDTYTAKLEFVIRDSNEINGKSWCENDIDHVEITSGVIDLYYDYFTILIKEDTYNLLQHLNINKDEKVLREYSIEGISYHDGIPVVFDSKIIDDKKAKMLGIFISGFIVLHELGHIFNGHCKFVNELYLEGPKYIAMYADEVEEKISHENALDRRTLEMDADMFATTQSLIHLMFLYDDFDNQVEIRIEPEDLFYWWSFAIRSHFLTCQDRFSDHQYSKARAHLPSVARWSMVCASAIEIIDMHDIFSRQKEKFIRLIIQGAQDAEIKFNNIKCAEYNWINEINNSSLFREYNDEVNLNWNKIRSRLQKYTRLPLAK